MDAKQLKFISELTGIESQLAAYADRETDRRAAFELAMSGLDGLKDEIRENMKVRLVDAKGKKGRKALSGKGQEHDLDTFKATRKGQGLSAGDMKKVGMALKPIATAAQQLLETKTRDGKPLFETQEEFERALTEELFTPLVREGVLPENFVLDQYSEVQQLLDATFKKYKETNTALRDDQEKSHAKAKGKYHGSGTGAEQFGAVMNRLATAPTRLADKVGIDKNMRRRLGIVQAGGEALMSMVELGETLKSWQLDATGTPKIEANFAKQLDPSKAGFTDADPDEARSKMAAAKRAEKIGKLGLPPETEKHILDMLDIQDNSDFESSKEGIEGYGDSIKEIIEKIALPSAEMDKVRKAIASAHHEAANVEAAEHAAKAIDAKLVAALNQHVRAGVGNSLAGLYAGAVDVDAVAEAAAQTKIDDQAIIREFGIAFREVFAGLDKELAEEGKTVMDAFIGVADGGALQKAIQTQPKTAFDPMVQATEGMLGRTLATIDPAKKRVVDAGVMKASVLAVAKQIDAALVAGLKGVSNASAAEAFQGLYAAEVDVAGAVEAATATPADGAALVSAFAEAFHSAMAQAAPDPTNPVFVNVGKAIKHSMTSAVGASAVSDLIATDVPGAFRLILGGAGSAIDNGLSSASELGEMLVSPDAQRALAAKSAFPDGGESALKELEKSDEEVKEYERQLVLIDQGGISSAELNTIEGLIEKLERDKLIAEMIVASAGILTSLASSTTSIIGQQTAAVTDTLVGEIVGPLKAAKLIVKFAVAMKAANDRRILLQKFSKSLNLAKKAVSPMQSTIQGFFNNKVEQVTFRAIEDALTLIQIASAILGSVPEPITLAVGKTLGAVATAGEGTLKVTEMLYNEAMLSKGWSTTLAFIRNPRDRATGLAALRLNPTLGMHAVAWAAMEKVPPEPVARAMLSDLGLNEQTLMVSGSEEKVRKYLETLLAEDRTLLDPEVVTPKWVPKPITLTTESFVVAIHRASTLAEPKLRKSNEPELLVYFKKCDALDLAALANSAKAGAIEPEVMEAHIADATKLNTLLRAYRPVSSDGAEHDGMVNVAANFMKLSADHESEVLKIAMINAGVQAKDVGRVTTRINKLLDELDTAVKANTIVALDPAFKKACELVREIQIVRMDENPGLTQPYGDLMTQTRVVGTALQLLVAKEEEGEEDDDEDGDQGVQGDQEVQPKKEPVDA